MKLKLKELIEKMLSQMEINTWTPSVTASTGTLVSSEGRLYGKIAYLRLTVKKSSATTSAANVFQGTLSNHKPLVDSMGGGYYNGCWLGLYIDTNGNVTVRNTGSTNVPSNSNVTVIINYIVGG